MITLNEVFRFWNKLSEIPVLDDCIDESISFDLSTGETVVFNQGHDLYDIWHWLESLNSEFCIGKLM